MVTISTEEYEDLKRYKAAVTASKAWASAADISGSIPRITPSMDDMFAYKQAALAAKPNEAEKTLSELSTVLRKVIK